MHNLIATILVYYWQSVLCVFVLLFSSHRSARMFAKFIYYYLRLLLFVNFKWTPSCKQLHYIQIIPFNLMQAAHREYCVSKNSTQYTAHSYRRAFSERTLTRKSPSRAKILFIILVIEPFADWIVQNILFIDVVQRNSFNAVLFYVFLLPFVHWQNDC